MQILAKRTLREFWLKHPRAETSLRTWFAIVSKAEWQSPTDVKAMFGGNVDFLADNRAVFDIGGNKYRLVVYIAYEHRRALIKFIGPHEEYDAINAVTVGHGRSRKAKR